MLEELMTTKEAANFMGYAHDYVSRLCREGKLPGAQMVAQKVWLIPMKSVIDYKPGPQGFAAVQARKRAEEAANIQEQNRVIRDVKGLPQEVPSSEEVVDCDYVSVEEAALKLGMSRRYVRKACIWGKFVGAKKSGDNWLIPSNSLKITGHMN